MSLTIADTAWAAGIIDGEGSIFVMIHGRKGKEESDGYIRKRDNYVLRISVQSTDRIMCQELKKIFPDGADFGVQRNNKEGQSNTLKWQVSGKRAANILRELLPFLRVKKAQAEVALNFQDNYKKHWKKMTDEDYAKQAELCQKLKNMKLSEKLGEEKY